MKCTNCGTEFEEGLFCPECGTKNDEGNIQEITPEVEVKPETINEQETGKKSKAKKEKPAKEKKTKTGILALISGILGFLTSIFVVGIIFDIIAIIMAFVSKKKGASKVVAYISLILGILGTAIFGVCLAYTMMQEPEVETNVYFDIVDMVNEGKLEEAKEAIETEYGSISYSNSSEGFNKTSIYYIYYKATEEYDELATVLADYLEENYNKVLSANDSKVTGSIEVSAIKARYEEIADKISQENKERIEALLKEFENMK